MVLRGLQLDPVPAQGRSITEEPGQHAGWQGPGRHIAPPTFTEDGPAEPVAPGKGGSLPIIIFSGDSSQCPEDPPQCCL